MPVIVENSHFFKPRAKHRRERQPIKTTNTIAGYKLTFKTIPIKLISKLIVDTLLLTLAVVTSLFLKTDDAGFFDNGDLFKCSIIVVPLTISLFFITGIYRASSRYVSVDVALKIAVVTLFSTIIFYLARITFFPSIPISIPVIYGSITLITITGSRFALRLFLENKNRANRQKIAIYGAGAAGSQVVAFLRGHGDFLPRVIIDDNKKMQGRTIYGTKVYSLEQAITKIEKLGIKTVLLALPSAPKPKRRGIVEYFQEKSIEVKTLPSLEDLKFGNAQIDQFQDIDISDLLGREPIQPDASLMMKNIAQKTVLVSGAGGSIGREICKQIILNEPKNLLVLDISEGALYQLMKELENNGSNGNIKIYPLVGSVLDKQFIKMILAKFEVDTIFHAAAYKHVTLMEQNIFQAVKNNVIGTHLLATEAIKAKVQSFTLISTDKAVSPTSFMGASKRIAELVCKHLQRRSKRTVLSIVRFGNVLGSSGSVVPKFKEQIKNGGPVTVTDKEVSRFFMSIPEASQLVIQASAMASGGEVFILDMGEPIKIDDLATKMIRLSGFEPWSETANMPREGKIEIVYTGLQPGEKLVEELAYNSQLINTLHPRIMLAKEDPTEYWADERFISKLNHFINKADYDGIFDLMTYYAPQVANKETSTDAILRLTD